MEINGDLNYRVKWIADCIAHKHLHSLKERIFDETKIEQDSFSVTEFQLFAENPDILESNAHIIELTDAEIREILGIRTNFPNRQIKKLVKCFFVC